MKPVRIRLRPSRVASPLLVAFAAAGCAHLPDAKVSYYLAKSDVSFKVVRTVTCDADNHVFIADAVTPTVTHFAEEQPVAAIDLTRLKGAFSDSDVKVEYYDDGRLKGFNGASTGQGEAILKTAISVVGSVFAFVKDKKQDTYPTECAALKKLGGDKPVALTYQGSIDPKASGEQTLKADPITSVIVTQNRLEPVIGHVCAAVTDTKTPQPKVTYDSKDKSKDILLPLREPGRVKVKVTAGGANSCQNDTLWEDYLTVAQVGKSYNLPVPPATTFGKRALGAAFSESGALTLVQFTSETGVGQTLGVAGAGLTATEGDTTAEKAEAIKAEADLIAQQQRLLQCQADPKNCK